MSFAAALAAVMLLLASMAAVHAFATRPRAEALFLLLTAVGFGYAFPFVDVNLLRHYAFHGELTVLGLPFHLGLTWFALYYLALVVAERLVGRDAPRVRLALVTGLVFGCLEVQWDLTMAEVGTIAFSVPSFFPAWPHGFHPGIPMFHALLGFNWVYASRVMGSGRQPLATLVALVAVVVLPLSIMAGVPLTTPLMAWAAARTTAGTQVLLDLLHFSSTFIACGFVQAWLLRLLGRVVGGHQ